jgi:hypothetical protein
MLLMRPVAMKKKLDIEQGADSKGDGSYSSPSKAAAKDIDDETADLSETASLKAESKTGFDTTDSKVEKGGK